jgi:hypothetical protein
VNTSYRSLLPLIAATLLFAPVASAESGNAQQEIASVTTVDENASSPVWDELRRMSSGFSRPMLIAGNDAGESKKDDKVSEAPASEDGKTAGASITKGGCCGPDGGQGCCDSDGVKSGDKANSDKAETKSSDTETANSDKVERTSSDKTQTKSHKAGSKSSGQGSGAALSSLKGLSPTESYLKVRDVIMNAKNVEELLPYLSRESATKAAQDLEKSKEGAREKIDGLALIKMMMPAKVKMTSEKINGDNAVLTAIPLVPSKMDEGMNELVTGLAQGMANAFGSSEKLPKEETETQGTIYMSLEDGVWKQDKEQWKTTSKEAPVEGSSNN